MINTKGLEMYIPTRTIECGTKVCDAIVCEAKVCCGAECSPLNPSLCGGKWPPTYTDSVREPSRPYGKCLSDVLITEECLDNSRKKCYDKYLVYEVDSWNYDEESNQFCFTAHIENVSDTTFYDVIFGSGYGEDYSYETFPSIEPGEIKEIEDCYEVKSEDIERGYIDFCLFVFTDNPFEIEEIICDSYSVGADLYLTWNASAVGFTIVSWPEDDSATLWTYVDETHHPHFTILWTLHNGGENPITNAVVECEGDSAVIGTLQPGGSFTWEMEYVCTLDKMVTIGRNDCFIIPATATGILDGEEISTERTITACLGRCE